MAIVLPHFHGRVGTVKHRQSGRLFAKLPKAGDAQQKERIKKLA